MKTSVLAKVLLMGLLVLLLLIPLAMIGSVLREREARRRTALAEVAGKWGAAQTVLGPVLTIPYRAQRTDKEGVVRTCVERAQLLPSTLKIEGAIAPERRWRGIFEVVVYGVDLTVTGTFPHPDASSFGLQTEDLLLDRAAFAVGLSDTRGIRQELNLTWDGRKLPFRPGPGFTSLFATGVHAPLEGLVEKGGGPHSFAFQVHLQGTDVLDLTPVGTETAAVLSGPWPSPSFAGAFLPESRQVTPQGFRATWTVSHFGRSFPQQWKTAAGDGSDAHREALGRSAFGVRLFLPADAYQQAERSIKYGALFIVLTFLTFFLFEVFSGPRLHALQYLLVGFALCLFYLLLVSLSEHIGFGGSYAVAAAATVVLVGGYSAAVLDARGRGALVGAALSALYGYLFVLLRLEDYALLLGSLALFAILAGVMWATRNVDWHALSAAPPAPPAAWEPRANGR